MRKVKRAVDDIARNKRILFHLDCGHTRIVTDKDNLMYCPAQLMAAMVPGAEIPCEQCPDLPPPPSTDASEVQQRLKDFHTWTEPWKVTR